MTNKTLIMKSTTSTQALYHRTYNKSLKCQQLSWYKLHGNQRTVLFITRKAVLSQANCAMPQLFLAD